MYHAIVEMLKERKDLTLDVICHHPLNMLLRDKERLNADELRFVMNPATHVDFLLYNQIGKTPVLAIEVDGFHYHKPGTKQYERDRMKDSILESYGIELLRFPTNGSGERKKLECFLKEYAERRSKS